MTGRKSSDGKEVLDREVMQKRVTGRKSSERNNGQEVKERDVMGLAMPKRQGAGGEAEREGRGKGEGRGKELGNITSPLGANWFRGSSW